MIKVNDEFSFEQVTHCWRLVHRLRTTDKKNKNKETITERVTYPGSLEQVLVAILERTQYDATDVLQLKDELQQTKSDIKKVVKLLAKQGASCA